MNTRYLASAFSILLATTITLGAIAYCVKSQEPIYNRIEERLEPLRSKLDAIRKKYGDGHPQVFELELMIQKLEEQLKSEPVLRGSNESTIDVAKLDDADLRKLVGDLLKRVNQLEQDVHVLKNPKARVDLLKK